MAFLISFPFLTAAGSFLYISLTDLMPELASGMAAASNRHHNHNHNHNHDKSVENESSSSETPAKIFFLQIGGICLGIVIMAIIGIYEEDLKRVLG